MKETLLYSKSMIQILKADSKMTDLGEEEFIIFNAVNPYALLYDYIFKNDDLLKKFHYDFSNIVDPRNSFYTRSNIDEFVNELYDTVDFPFSQEYLSLGGKNCNNIGYLNRLTGEFALVYYEKGIIMWENRYEHIALISFKGNTVKTTFNRTEGGIDHNFFDDFFKCVDKYSEDEKYSINIEYNCPNCGKAHPKLFLVNSKNAVLNASSIIQGQSFNCECSASFRTIEPYELFEIV